MRKFDPESKFPQEDWEEVDELRKQAVKESGLSEHNKERLREIRRIIVSAVIISSDRKFLMGKKDPEQGGVYAEDWHIIGGGTDGEDFMQALKREVKNESGIDIDSADTIDELPYIGEGEAPKTLKSGERVWCRMEFHRYEVYINQPSWKIKVQPGEDIVELRWFSADELPNIKQAADGKEFFIKAGYISDEPESKK